MDHAARGSVVSDENDHGWGAEEGVRKSVNERNREVASRFVEQQHRGLAQQEVPGFEPQGCALP
jgi:hypothetical protein